MVDSTRPYPREWAKDPVEWAKDPVEWAAHLRSIMTPEEIEQSARRLAEVRIAGKLHEAKIRIRSDRTLFRDRVNALAHKLSQLKPVPSAPTTVELVKEIEHLTLGDRLTLMMDYLNHCIKTDSLPDDISIYLGRPRRGEEPYEGANNR